MKKLFFSVILFAVTPNVYAVSTTLTPTATVSLISHSTTTLQPGATISVGLGRINTLITTSIISTGSVFQSLTVSTLTVTSSGTITNFWQKGNGLDQSTFTRTGSINGSYVNNATYTFTGAMSGSNTNNSTTTYTGASNGTLTNNSTTTFTAQANSFTNGIAVSTGGGALFFVGKSSVSLSAPSYIMGSNTNDSAASGFIGETLSSVTAVGLITAAGATGVFVNVGQVTLTAGTWLLTGMALSKANTSATWTINDVAISINSGNTITDQLYTVNELYNVRTYLAADQESITIPNYILRVANGATQNVFLKVALSYGAGGPPQIRSAGLFAIRCR